MITTSQHATSATSIGIVENNDIHLDDNNTILVRVWVTWPQQAGGEASLKDRLDPPPSESGLSPDSFVLCI